ncbi:Transmembrane amino acid transporter protein [Trichomonas vaginalis G3]|uniref:Transmembrane amino acid transporter protein n=1 Tax=Trichomonas vaginalis (strain ATCC PRA-98 / G3) TaxID=412133 RepID=A2DVJ1_TRIV3|nr:amino acid transmembrane transporter protein [Trichomonas vaginalis G3]EAY15533.1 Transmembrane amino acid transporter protein [Trichomonas vaginalis G3]KAI5526179.1 amino acid transmembrane transporter protein [Trichomonas vaginalis G3]|eukprot:XP_001327756.1 Transmembrane amino acid transporter protein [Trichomonas vaginalis G3]
MATEPNAVELEKINDPNPPVGVENDNEEVLEIGQDGLPTSIGQDVEQHPELHPMEQKEEDITVNIKRVKTCGTIFNILDSLMGSGILAVPNSFTNIGIIPSFVIMAVIATLAWVAAVMVLYLLDDTNAKTFDQLAAIILGPIGSRILTILNLFFLICCLLGFLILGGDMIVSWFKLGNIDVTSLGYRVIMMVVYAFCIPIALSIPKKITFLSYFAVGSVFCIFFFCGAVVGRGIEHIVKHGINNTITLGIGGMGIFSSISIHGLAFALPLVFIPAMSIFYKPEVKVKASVSFYGQFICYLLVSIPGLFGYLQFGKDTAGNVLNSYPVNDILMVVVRSGFFIVVSCAYPMLAQSVMASWSFFVFKESQHIKLPPLKLVCVHCLTHLIPLIIAIFLAEVKPALLVGGALGGCLAQFTFPCWMWVKHSDKPVYHWVNILCILFGVFGIVTGVCATYQAVVDAIAAFSKK